MPQLARCAHPRKSSALKQPQRLRSSSSNSARARHRDAGVNLHTIAFTSQEADSAPQSAHVPYGLPAVTSGRAENKSQERLHFLSKHPLPESLQANTNAKGSNGRSEQKRNYPISPTPSLHGWHISALYLACGLQG